MLKSINGLSEFLNKYLITLSNSVLCISLLVILHSCGTSKYPRLNKKMDQVIDLDSFSNHQFGILVCNPQQGDTLIKISAEKYFIPASNVKIFTLYTALELLPESLPAIQYYKAADTLYFKGLGDPTLLHQHFQDSTTLKFLDQYNILYCSTSNFQEDPWPAGWSWEDFDQAFAAERSSLPVYGNRLSVYADDSIHIRPQFMKDSIHYGVTHHLRERAQNQFYIPIVLQDSLEIPFKLRSGLIQELLSSELGKPVQQVDELPEGPYEILRGSDRDTVLRRMMIDSDNFLAEQLLLNASSVLSDTLSGRKAINYMLDEKLSELEHVPRWVDGSGLSRYNLFTPASMVQVLSKMYAKYGFNYTMNFFPAGGVSGTLENNFDGDDKPYVFAKSGTLGNTYCLSGFLQTKSGKTLVFSIMNNSFRIPQQKVKTEITKLLEWIRDEY